MPVFCAFPWALVRWDIPSSNVIPREISGSIHNQDDRLEKIAVRLRPESKQSKMKADGIHLSDPTFHNVFPLDPSAKRIQPSALSQKTLSQYRL